MSIHHVRRLRFELRERYVRLWAWLRQLQAARSAVPSVESSPDAARQLWLQRLRQHFRLPPF